MDNHRNYSSKYKNITTSIDKENAAKQGAQEDAMAVNELTGNELVKLTVQELCDALMCIESGPDTGIVIEFLEGLPVPVAKLAGKYINQRDGQYDYIFEPIGESWSVRDK